MQHLHGHAQAVAQATHGLRGQSDLRHQQQGLLALGEHLFDQREIHLGLAAAGDAIEQEWLEAPQRFADSLDRLLLLFAQRRSFGDTRRFGGLGLGAFDQAGLVKSSGRIAPAGQHFMQQIGRLRSARQGVEQRTAAAATTSRVERAVAGGGECPGFFMQIGKRAVFAQSQRQRVGVSLAGCAQPVVGGAGEGGHQLGVEQGSVIEHA